MTFLPSLITPKLPIVFRDQLEQYQYYAQRQVYLAHKKNVQNSFLSYSPDAFHIHMTNGAIYTIFVK